MQKRKAKRKKAALNVDLEISRQINEQEKMQKVALLDFNLKKITLLL